jgi:RimJ/RimL family protein N-acetyltransferase
VRRALSILADHCRELALPELAALLWNALFRSETILIYCATLRGSDAVDRDGALPVVKGNLADLERARSSLQRVPWEFKCDLYDGVKDFFTYRDAESGTLGHISWIYHEQDPNRTLRLCAKECEIMFCLTLPEYRGRGLYPSALKAIQRHLKAQGYRRCFICVRDDNVSSIRGIEKSGFRLVGTTRFRKLLGFQVSRRRDTRQLTTDPGLTNVP